MIGINESNAIKIAPWTGSRQNARQPTLNPTASRLACLMAALSNSIGQTDAKAA
jgi:hypothetical protein